MSSDVPPPTFPRRDFLKAGGALLVGGPMKFKVALTIAFCFGAIAAAQQPNTFPQPTAAKEVMVTAIPGVIAAGAKWKLVWQGPDNADGIIGTKDGGLLFAQEQPSTVGMLDPSDKFSILSGRPMAQVPWRTTTRAASLGRKERVRIRAAVLPNAKKRRNWLSCIPHG